MIKNVYLLRDYRLFKFNFIIYIALYLLRDYKFYMKKIEYFIFK